MALIVAGVSFRTAPLELREKLVISPAESPAVLAPLLNSGHVSEVAVVSTCNRTELYAVAEGDGSAAALWHTLGVRIGGDASGYGYERSGREAAAHLFRVASGMDSMILGEAQIHGQVRDAWEHSREHSGVALNRLFQSALQVASRVRTETGIARGAASVSSAAVQLARQIFGSLRGRQAMVIGAGQMAELALECLVSEGVRAAVVANRSYAKAELLAESYGARAMHFDECWAELANVDLLISSTAAPHTVVGRAQVEEALAGRGSDPFCILDIALPRDVEPSVAEIDNVFLYDLDDLSDVVNANRERRMEELPAAEAIVTNEVERYWKWYSGLAAVPVLTRFRDEMDEMRERELQVALRRLKHLPPGDQEVLAHFSRSLMNKFLHTPSVRLREAAANGRGLGVIDAAQYLFALEGGRTRTESGGTSEGEEESPGRSTGDESGEASREESLNMRREDQS